MRCAQGQLRWLQALRCSSDSQEALLQVGEEASVANRLQEGAIGLQSEEELLDASSAQASLNCSSSDQQAVSFPWLAMR